MTKGCAGEFGERDGVRGGKNREKKEKRDEQEEREEERGLVHR